MKCNCLIGKLSSVELSLTKYCLLTVTVNNNTNENHDRIIFTIKDTKLYEPVVTLSANDNQELLKLGN